MLLKLPDCEYIKTKYPNVQYSSLEFTCSTTRVFHFFMLYQIHLQNVEAEKTHSLNLHIPDFPDTKSTDKK